jgi:tRNA (guanine-N7-)-methyltransferase
MLDVITSVYGACSQLGLPGQLVELDMGCGKGGFTIDLAKRFPDRQIIGADINFARLRKIKNRIEHQFHLENVKLYRASATEFIGLQLPRFSIDRCHILCPDPWPKAKHRHNRLLCSEFFSRLANVIKPGGVLHISTDDQPYLAFILEAVKGNRFFDIDPSGIEDIRDIKTDFERHWETLGKVTTHLAYRRNENG